MQAIQRFPAIPLITNDPYFSYWCAADRLTDVDTSHWAGATKRLLGSLEIDGISYRFLGLGDAPAMETVELIVTPTSTKSVFQAAGVELTLKFTTPLLLSDPNVLSIPATYASFALRAIDGKTHSTALRFQMLEDICFDGDVAPELFGDSFHDGVLQYALMGQKRQKVLCHSGDHITIDWGYAYLASTEGTKVSEVAGSLAIEAGFAATIAPDVPYDYEVLIGYDDVASINYFGQLRQAWYARNGMTFIEALRKLHANRSAILCACCELDEQLSGDALKLGGVDYEQIVCASYRQCISAHKLIADENGEMIFLSKENDSNGCIGTVDVSYPSTPLFLLYNPEFVRAMCRPVFRFAHLPVWTYDFAPHDVGRYPHATGQVYGLAKRERVGDSERHGARIHNGDVYPPFYLYPASSNCYGLKNQMPVEECGNMLLMVAATVKADGDIRMARQELPILRQWVSYLEQYGEDPGEQLCTDDFAGHLAHNINLSAKAVMGIASFAYLLDQLGETEEAAVYHARAKAMAASWLARAAVGEHTALTFSGEGWSMKYNLVWDLLFKTELLGAEFYEKETASYIPRINQYGLPLDARATYTKSDWILWIAAMAEDKETFDALVAPVAEYLRKSATRVPFSDWYDTVSGNYHHFIARSVQGGVFMPLLREKWR